jgi:hypothetical protein
MYTKTVPTPRITQITFLVFVMIMMTPFFTYIASASPLDKFCERHFNLSFLMPVMPTAKKKCKVQFQRLETEWRTWFYNNK